MKPAVPLGRLYVGFLLVGMGLAMLASRAGWAPAYLRISPHTIWPMVVILIGLSFVRVSGWAGWVLGVALTLALAAASVMATVSPTPGYFPGRFHFEWKKNSFEL